MIAVDGQGSSPLKTRGEHPVEAVDVALVLHQAARARK